MRIIWPYSMVFSYMLAPLEDNTDSAFRELCFRHGADLTFTEMTRLAGLVRRNKSTEQKIEILNDIEVPTQLQIAGNKESELSGFLKNFKPTKGFRGFNFNLGCPSKNVIKQGVGCAMIKRVSKVKRMIEIVKEYGYPCSIKMRLGQNPAEKENKVYLNLIIRADADFFVVHVRHGNEHYKNNPDYSVLPACVATGKDIIANGDIDSVEKVNLVKEIGVKGVMIGRAAIYNPAIFERLKGMKETPLEVLKNEYEELETKYFTGHEKYRRNILERFGKHTSNNSEVNVRG